MLNLVVSKVTARLLKVNMHESMQARAGMEAYLHEFLSRGYMEVRAEVPVQPGTARPVPTG
jgi:hypothetical protein